MYKYDVGMRVMVRDNSEWTCVHETYLGRCGTVVGFTPGAFHPINECYNVKLDSDPVERCFCSHDLSRVLTGSR